MTDARESDDAAAGPGPEELARRAQAGAADAFEALVARFEGPLYHFLRLRVGRGPVAEELAQETFLRAWRKLHLYDPRQRFSTWLFTLAKRVAASHVRRRKSDADRTVESGPEDRALQADPAELAADRDEGLHLWRLAGRVLSVEQRSALWLRYAEDLPAAEIARILGRRTVTVRVLLFRAREALAEHLAAPVPRNRGNGAAARPLLAQNDGGSR